MAVPSQEAAASLFDSLLVSLLIGNGDAHLKNYGVLYAHPHADKRLAPVYDVLNTTAYIEGDTPALKMFAGGQKQWPSLSDLRKLGDEYGVSNVEERFETANDAIMGALTDRPFAEDTKFLSKAILEHRAMLEGGVQEIRDVRPVTRLSP